MTLPEGAIDGCHRLGTKKPRKNGAKPRNRPIIVKFCSYKYRSQVFGRKNSARLIDIIQDYIDRADMNIQDDVVRPGRHQNRAAAVVAWNLVISRDGGAGWLNDGVEANRVIRDPLYEGVTSDHTHHVWIGRSYGC